MLKTFCFAVLFSLGYVLFAAGTAQAAEPAPAPTCTVEGRSGVTQPEEEAVEEILCSKIRASHANPGSHRVRVAKLGTKYIITMLSDGPSGHTEQQVVLMSLDEMPVAAPRLVEAQAEQKPVEETVKVDNVISGEETRTAKKKSSETHAWLGMVGVVAPTVGSGGGMSFGISAGSSRWSFVTEGKIAGQAFNQVAAIAAAIITLGQADLNPTARLSYLDLSGGVRHHFSDSDLGFFAGTGLALDYIGISQPKADGSLTYQSGRLQAERSTDGNAGLAGYAEVGLDVMRTHAVGGSIILRVDMPAFAVDTIEIDPSNPKMARKVSTYAPIIGTSIAMRF